MLDVIKLFFLKQSPLPLLLVKKCIETYESRDLFLDMNDDYFIKKEDILRSAKVPQDSFQEFINTTRGRSSTSFLYGLSYTSYFNQRPVKSDIKLKEYLYISFPLFTSIIAQEVSTLIREHSDRPYLILDLRDNLGGHIDECMKILDTLVPECNAVNICYKNSEVSMVTSGHPVQFDKIFILLNSHASSCSEILALALKLNLPEVHLLGNATAKKDVGQSTFVNSQYRYIFNITSFKWNVSGSDVEDLQKYLLQAEDGYNEFDDYFRVILGIACP